jgi:DNA-binding NarL/FixJ family response regulator
VTARKISSGDDSRATSVATRRNAACASARRSRSVCDSALAIQMPIVAGYFAVVVAAEVSGSVRVVIADDDFLVREGVVSLLDRNGFDVVGQAGDGDELITLVRRHRPDLAIVDIRMPPTHSTEGLDAARLIRAELPDVAIVVLSAYIDINHALELLGSGERSGYLLKRRVTAMDEFIETLQRIVKGGSVVDPTLISELVGARRANDPLEALTQREREVLALMAEGRSNAGVARQLWVSERTVEKHVQSILAKLGLPDTTDDHRRVLAVVTFLRAR